MKSMRTNDAVSQLFYTGDLLSLGREEIIIGNTPEPDGVYYIRSGYIKIYAVSDRGDENIHIIYGPDEVFPITWAFLGTQPETLFYETLSRCAVWRISRELMLACAQTNLAFCYAFSMRMAKQFRVFSDRVDNLEYRNASERVAYRLLFLASRFGVRNGEGIRIDAPLTHEVFANSVNLARETVSRQIEKLEHECIIKKSGGYFYILDSKSLSGKLSQPVSFKIWDLQ